MAYSKEQKAVKISLNNSEEHELGKIISNVVDEYINFNLKEKQDFRLLKTMIETRVKMFIENLLIQVKE